MSFGSGGFGSGGGGGFGAFGSSNNNTTNTNTTSSSLFGGNTATSGGFGFGSNNNNASNTTNPFGATRTGFGAPATSTGGSLFGGGTSTSGGFGGSTGGFGNNASNASNTGATLSTGFGGTSNTGNSLFGGNRPATSGFGNTNASSGGLFGSANTNSGFGGSNTGSNPFGSNPNTTSNPFGPSSNNAGFGSANNSGHTTTSNFSGFGSSNASSATNLGTASTPFAPVTEKDTGAAGLTSAYQTITMQPQYQGKSLEELRLEDYAQNRRLAQNNSFGASNTFGGFNPSNNTANNTAGRSLFGGTSGTPGFGGASNTAFGASNTAFGASNNTASNTSGGLFGNNASTTTGTGLFGNNASTNNTSGGFSAGSNTSGGLFGGNNANNTNTAGSFGAGFGTANNNTANASSGGLFGSANNAGKSAFGGGFGTNNNTSTNTGAGLFGGSNTNNNQPTSTGLFGNNTNTGGFGANTGTSLFNNNNNNANRPAGSGLFGAAANTSNNTGGLFGSTQNANTGNNTGTGLFGAANNTNTGGGLFGAANQAKPAGTGLFGSAAANAGTSGGLFGSTNNNQSGGLFGNNNQANAGSSLFNNQPQKTGTSLFGGNNAAGNSLFGGNNNTSGGLFGGNNATNQNAGLFSASQNQNNAGNSMFSNSQNQGQANQLTASITGDPYGNAQLFASLASPSPPVGPLATPLSGARPAPKQRASLLASVRGSPMLGANSTPRARPGYGFSYSNYNSPATSTPLLTPGASSLLRPTGSLGSALSSRLSKSFSTSNLRGEIGDGQSLIRTPAQGQGSLLLGGSGSLGSGNIRKLKIDRSLRTDLFGDSLKKSADTSREDKRVSFDQSAGKENTSSNATPSASNALVVHDESERTPVPENGNAQSNGGSSLTTVPEEAGANGTDQSTPRKPVEAGEYFTEPSLKLLHSMSRSQLASLDSFTVGRQGVGKIVFGRGTRIDLNGVAIDDICGKIVQLKPRSATVYEDDHDKPAVGKGLNVPSTIYLEQSWPRKTRVSGAAQQKSTSKEIERHKNRLRKVSGTTFVDYNEDTGIWSFTVEHFTTYELDDEEETTMQDTTHVTAPGELPDAPQNGDNTQHSFDTDKTTDSPDIDEQDDTFQFKLSRRSHNTLSLPGGFDDSMANLSYEYDEPSADEMQADDSKQAEEDLFVENGAVQPPSPGALQHYDESVMEVEVEDEDEQEIDVPGSFHEDVAGLKGILKSFGNPGADESPDLIDISWEEQLQRTLSPKKRDRQALKDVQSAFSKKTDADPDTLLKKSLLSRSQLGQSHLATKSAKKLAINHNDTSQAFKSGMDIMKSLWADDKQRTGKPTGLLEASRAINPARATRNSTDGNDADFHRSLKPSFTNKGTLVYATNSQGVRKASSRRNNALHVVPRDSTTSDVNTSTFLIQRDPKNTVIEFDPDMIDEDDAEQVLLPEVMTSSTISFASLAESVTVDTTAAEHERAVWRLSSILFDNFTDSCPDLVAGMSEELTNEYDSTIRKDAFYQLWNEELQSTVGDQLKTSPTAEATALFHLTVGDTVAASEALTAANNHKLAVLVAQLPTNNSTCDLFSQQIETWQNRKDWSEFSDGQRVLYSLLAGETCTVPGVSGAKEDRVDAFCLSERYGLTWKQSLSLKVRYSRAESLEEATAAYASDLAEGREKVLPKPWHAKEPTAQDTLLSLLKVLIEQTSPDELFDNTVVSSDPQQHRLTWQLASILAAKGIIRLDDDKMDALTLSFAWEQESTGNFIDAIWTVLHLNDEEGRLSAIRGVLERNNARLGAHLNSSDDAEADQQVFHKITDELHIHPSLFYCAKASYASSIEHDHWVQCEYLMLALTRDSLREAHTVLCRELGPTAVIEHQYDTLHLLCHQMLDIGTHWFENWRTGGQLFLELADFMQLSPEQRHRKEGVALLKKISKSLQAQDELGLEGFTLEMKVARLEVRKIVKEYSKTADNADAFKSVWSEGTAVRNKGQLLLERYLHALGHVS